VIRFAPASDLLDEERSPIAFALDFPSVDEARRAAVEVAPAIGMLKVGLELFVHFGPSVLSLGRDVSLPVFLDLKLHDIPETVERAVGQASALGARIVTVHASGGRAMLRRAVTRAEKDGGTLAICAVTILTSLDESDMDDLGIEPKEGQGGRSRVSRAAESLARLAYAEGVRWFVCSPKEVLLLRAALGADAVLVTPGIRPAAADSGDQKRVATPKQAMEDGADWLVVGRPIRDAPNRLAAARAIEREAALARGRS
jgi:orotidine-5'-phosphate decarboxylase